MDKETTKMIPGDELHLTMLMAPYSLNLVTGQDRQDLLAFGRAAFDAGKNAGQATPCLHHIAEPETAASMLRQCIDKATFPTNMDKHSALQWVDQLEAEVDAERRHHGIRNASAVRTLHALGYSWSGTDSWQPPAPQAAVPLPLLVRDIARDLGITVPQACIALKPLGNYSTNSAVTAEMARMLRDHFPAPVHPAEGVANEDEAFEKWWSTPHVWGLGHKAAQRSAFAAGVAHAAATQPAAQGIDAATLDALQEAESVLNSINMGKQHKVVQADGDVTYWQREEWCKWAKDEVLPKVTVALAAQAKQGGA